MMTVQCRPAVRKVSRPVCRVEAGTRWLTAGLANTSAVFGSVLRLAGPRSCSNRGMVRHRLFEGALECVKMLIDRCRCWSSQVLLARVKGTLAAKTVDVHAELTHLGA